MSKNQANLRRPKDHEIAAKLHTHTKYGTNQNESLHCIFDPRNELLHCGDSSLVNDFIDTLSDKK